MATGGTLPFSIEVPRLGYTSATTAALEVVTRSLEAARALLWCWEAWALLLLSWLSRRRMVPIVLCLAALAFILGRRAGLGWEAFSHLALSLGVFAACRLGWRAWKDGQLALAQIVAVSTLTGLLLTAGSSNGFVMFYYVIPSFIIPLAAPRSDNDGAPRHVELFALGLVGLLSTLSLIASIRMTYRDCPPRECRAEIACGAFAGIRTSARRAFLIEEMNRLLTGKTFAIAGPKLPGAYFFGDVRSSFGSINILFTWPDEMQRQVLLRMEQERRFPEVIILVRSEPWSWGMNVGVSAPAIHDPSVPFMRYINCVKGQRLAQQVEYEAWDTVAAKLRPCVEESLTTTNGAGGGGLASRPAL